MVAAPSGKVAPATLRQISSAIAAKRGVSKKQANEILDDFVSAVRTHLKKGAHVRILGLGTLRVRKRAARNGRNPSTGAPIKIKAGKKVAFVAAKLLKSSI